MVVIVSGVDMTDARRQRPIFCGLRIPGPARTRLTEKELNKNIVNHLNTVKSLEVDSLAKNDSQSLAAESLWAANGVDTDHSFSGTCVMPGLFDPLVVGDWELPSRIIMAPLTRCRSSAGRVPNAPHGRVLCAAGIGGLDHFGSDVRFQRWGVGYPDTPGIWSGEQVEGWKLITRAVHGAGGRILLQLWHVGRMSDPLYLNGELPVAPSAIAPAGHISLVRPLKTFVTPRALETSELPGIVEEYRRGRGACAARRNRRC